LALTISQVGGWDLATLSGTATELTASSGTLTANASAVINELDRVSPDWEAEAYTAAAVVAKDRAGQMNERSERWKRAALILDEASEQIGLLKQEITATAQDFFLKSLFDFADDGSVSVSAGHLARIAAAYPDDTEGFESALKSAERSAAQLEDKLKTLLMTADLAAQRYDWRVEGALLGLTEVDRPFVPRISSPPPQPAGPIAGANEDGSGPDDYNTHSPDLAEQIYLQGLRAAAKTGGFATGGNLEMASDMLDHFFDNSGHDYKVDVNGMIKDMDDYKTANKDDATGNYLLAASNMPVGYSGPVAFQGDWQGGSRGFRADPLEHPDYWAALGTVSYQTSGVAIPDENGKMEIQYRSSIYDYYNWDSTKKSPSEQYSDLNELHRAGWAQNYAVTGTSDAFEFGYPS